MAGSMMLASQLRCSAAQQRHSSRASTQPAAPRPLGRPHSSAPPRRCTELRASDGACVRASLPSMHGGLLYLKATERRSIDR